MKTIFGLFETYQQANEAVLALGNLGFTSDEVSVLAQESVLRQGESTAASGAAAGAASGATLGGIAGLIAGIAGFTIPGIGPLLGVGFLASILGTTAVGAGAGAVAGGALGALADLGASDTHARRYEKAIRAGHILLAIRTPEASAREVKEVLTEYGASEVHTQETPRVRAR
jgi:uncharacterized membrane protein